MALFAVAVSAGPLAAQSAQQVNMPAGNYVVQARDTTKAKEVAIAGWPFSLKGNGAFVFTSPDELTFSGKLVQKDGVATYTDQGCETPALYTIRQERGGYAFDFKSGGCAENTTSLDKLLFVKKK
jgi:hypothetical protein